MEFDSGHNPTCGTVYTARTPRADYLIHRYQSGRFGLQVTKRPIASVETFVCSTAEEAMDKAREIDRV